MTTLQNATSILFCLREVSTWIPSDDKSVPLGLKVFEQDLAELQIAPPHKKAAISFLREAGIVA